MRAINLSPRPDIATRLLAGVTVPDTASISRAIEFARERSEPYLFNHAMRFWRAIRTGLQAGVDGGLFAELPVQGVSP